MGTGCWRRTQKEGLKHGRGRRREDKLRTVLGMSQIAESHKSRKVIFTIYVNEENKFIQQYRFKSMVILPTLLSTMPPLPM